MGTAPARRMSSWHASLAQAIVLVGLLGCEANVGKEPDVHVHSAELRPDAPGPLDTPPVFEAGDRVEHHDSAGGAFRIHFTRSGVHRVLAQDGDGSGVPDYVEQAAREYDAILTFYRDTLGFSPPLDDTFLTDNGGDGRFDVYLLDFATTADGSFRVEGCLPDQPARCTGYMVQENDFDGRNAASRTQAIRIVASHELFHAIEASYRGHTSVVLNEGSAVWASETYDPELSDFEGFLAGFLSHPERSLTQDSTSPVDPFGYGSALFFRFLEERFGRDSVRELWEALGDDSGATTPWTELLDRLLQQHHGSSLAQAFAEFTRWNLYTGVRADPEAAYRDGATYPEVAEQTAELPFEDALVRVFPLAARFYRVSPQGPGPIGVVAVGDADAGILEGLQLMLAREQSGRIVEVQSADGSAGGALVIDADAESVIHAVILNTRDSGESARPALCLGDATQLRDCMLHLGSAAPSPPDAPPHDSGCAVTNPQRHDRRGQQRWPLLLLTLSAIRVWMRRRSGRASSSFIASRAPQSYPPPHAVRMRKSHRSDQFTQS